MTYHPDRLTFLSIVRLISLLVWLILILPFAFVGRYLLPWVWWFIPRICHKGLCAILGLKVDAKGMPSHDQSVLYVSNHISWKDILVLGAVIPKASFVSKAEVGSNFIVRQVVNLQKTIYVQRSKRSESKKQSLEMVERIHNGDSLILFPEGTTTRGVQVAPFKSTLFSVAEMIVRSEKNVTIQPITLSYTHVNNLAVLRSQRIRIGWIGDEGFWAHFKYALARRKTRVTVDFHSPITCDETMNRKKLALECEQVVREGLAVSHRDRG